MACRAHLLGMTVTRPDPQTSSISVEDELIALGRRLAIRTRAEQELPAHAEDAEVLDVFTALAALPLGRSIQA